MTATNNNIPISTIIFLIFLHSTELRFSAENPSFQHLLVYIKANSSKYIFKFKLLPLCIKRLYNRLYCQKTQLYVANFDQFITHHVLAENNSRCALKKSLWRNFYLNNVMLSRVLQQIKSHDEFLI